MSPMLIILVTTHVGSVSATFYVVLILRIWGTFQPLYWQMTSSDLAFLRRAISIQLNGPLHFISIIKSLSYPSRDIYLIYESKVQALKLGKCFHIYVIFTCPWPEMFLLSNLKEFTLPVFSVKWFLPLSRLTKLTPINFGSYRKVAAGHHHKTLLFIM